MSKKSKISNVNMNVLSALPYIDALRNNIIRSQAYYQSQGKWQSKAPIGYVNTRDSNNHADIMIDTIRAPLVKKLFEEFATGEHSIKSITNLANELGLTSKNSPNQPLSQDSIKNILNNPFYYGEMRVKGKLIPHIYKPIVDKALFDKVQKILSKKALKS